MKKTLYLVLLLTAAFSVHTKAQDASTFPKGEKAANAHHTGDVWLNHVSNADKTFQYAVALATFAPGAKLDWHIHPGGQQLLITEGSGYYQERGKPVQLVHKGDVIKCAPGVEHWHASTPDSGFAYLAISDSQPTQWLERVPGEEYRAIKKEPKNSTGTEQQVTRLSQEKWQWMADKNVEKLDELFDEKSVFVHMGGSWGKGQEINVIKSGGIWYKEAHVHSATVNGVFLVNGQRITLSVFGLYPVLIWLVNTVL